MGKALLVIDVQEDFCEDGRLAVEGGNEVARLIREYAKENEDFYEAIVFTKDWHNPWPDDNDGHFSENPDYVDSWPLHCESREDGSGGTDFHPAITVLIDELRMFDWSGDVFYKGQGFNHYSGFNGVNLVNDKLADSLRNRGITEVDVVGIAGDYCVRETALDAVKEGFTTTLLTDMIASVRGPEATLATVREVEDANSVQG